MDTGKGHNEEAEPRACLERLRRTEYYSAQDIHHFGLHDYFAAIFAEGWRQKNRREDLTSSVHFCIAMNRPLEEHSYLPVKVFRSFFYPFQTSCT